MELDRSVLCQRNDLTESATKPDDVLEDVYKRQISPPENQLVPLLPCSIINLNKLNTIITLSKKSKNLNVVNLTNYVDEQLKKKG